MTRTRYEIKRVLFINGVRIHMAGGVSPTMGLLEELESCYNHGNPWNDYWIESFTVKSVTGKEVYARYDVKAVSKKIKQLRNYDAQTI